MKVYRKQSVLATIGATLNLLHFLFLVVILLFLFTIKTQSDTTHIIFSSILVYATIIIFYMFEVGLSIFASFKIKYCRSFSYLFLLFGVFHIITSILFWNIIYVPIQSIYMIFVGIIYLLTAFTTILSKETSNVSYTLNSVSKKSFSSLLKEYNEDENHLAGKK